MHRHPEKVHHQSRVACSGNVRSHSHSQILLPSILHPGPIPPPRPPTIPAIRCPLQLPKEHKVPHAAISFLACMCSRLPIALASAVRYATWDASDAEHGRRFSFDSRCFDQCSCQSIIVHRSSFIILLPAIVIVSSFL